MDRPRCRAVDATEQPLDLGQIPEMKHTVDTNLLIQDSHIHIMIYAIVAALLSLIIFGLDWPAGAATP